MYIRNDFMYVIHVSMYYVSSFVRAEFRALREGCLRVGSAVGLACVTVKKSECVKSITAELGIPFAACALLRFVLASRLAVVAAFVFRFLGVVSDVPSTASP